MCTTSYRHSDQMSFDPMSVLNFELCRCWNDANVEEIQNLTTRAVVVVVAVVADDAVASLKNRFASLDVVIQLEVHQCQSVCGLSAAVSNLSHLGVNRHVEEEKCECVVVVVLACVVAVVAVAVALAAAEFATEGYWKFV